MLPCVAASACVLAHIQTCCTLELQHCECVLCWRQVDYSCELGPPVVTIADARRAGAFHDPPAVAGPNSNLPDGQESALPAVDASPLQIRGAKCAPR